MIAILSPAKRMRYLTDTGIHTSTPRFTEETVHLAAWMRQFNLWELEQQLNVNPQLALDAYSYFSNYQPEQQLSPAILSYRGLAFQHLRPDCFTADELRYANQRVRILSAFYGCLCPLDGIMPYRLEFLCRVKPHGQGLYQYWGDKVYQELFSTGKTIVNLASQEYARLILPYLTPYDNILHCDFLAVRGGRLRTIATEAKMVRGAMARFIVKTRSAVPDDLKNFRYEGYAYSKKLSSDSRYIYLKDNY